MKDRTIQLFERFFAVHKQLQHLRPIISKACEVLLKTYENGGKVLICGNGGSCADGDHIVGELMKGFLLKRPLERALKDKFENYYGAEGAIMSEKLQCGLPAISLNAHSALMSAFSNDVDPQLIYAQQVMGYASKGDIVIGISSSGNSTNVIYALMAAKVAGAVSIGIIGRDGGKIGKLADISIVVPEWETYRIQEHHLAIYHLICAFVESERFIC